MTLLLGYSGPRYLLLTLAGPRPLLLTCPPELRFVAEAAASLHSLQATAPAPLRDDPPRRVEDRPPVNDRPRPPDKHIDPRTVFKRKPAEAVGPRTRAAEPPHTAAASAATHDHTIIPTNPGFRVAEQGVKALVTYLRTSQILAAKKERTVGDATYIEFLPDVFAHLAFTEGAAPSGPPSILEGTLWFSSKPAAVPFGDPTLTSHFRLEIVGARFPLVSAAFVARLHQILYLRPVVISTPHDPTRLRAPSPRLAAEPIPRFDMQET